MRDTPLTAAGAILASVILFFGGFVLGGRGDIPASVTATPTAVIGNVPASLCPADRGWQDASAPYEHIIVLSCVRGDWVVRLHPSGEFNYAVPQNQPGSEPVFDPALVPGWPK